MLSCIGNGYVTLELLCFASGTMICHVKLDQHDILFAESLPAESYMDLGSRPWFELSLHLGFLKDPNFVPATAFP